MTCDVMMSVVCDVSLSVRVYTNKLNPSRHSPRVPLCAGGGDQHWCPRLSKVCVGLCVGRVLIRFVTVCGNGCLCRLAYLSFLYFFS